jgi:hypothetical protein
MPLTLSGTPSGYGSETLALLCRVFNELVADALKRHALAKLAGTG